MKLTLDPIEVKVRMVRLGLTQKTLSEQSGISKQTLSYGMNGKRLSPDVVGKLSAALGCGPSEIVTEKGG